MTSTTGLSSEGAVVLQRRAAFPPRIPTLCVVTVFVEEESGIAKVRKIMFYITFLILRFRSSRSSEKTWVRQNQFHEELL